MKLGNLLRDVVTGFEGIAVSRVEYINGCTQFCVQGKAVDGKMPDGVYLDHQRLVVVHSGVALPSSDTGGPQRDVPSSFYRG